MNTTAVDFGKAFDEAIRYGKLSLSMTAENNQVVYQRAENTYKLTIHYKDGSTYHVKNAYNVKLLEHKSGGHDVEYDYDYVKKEVKPHGVETTEADKHVKTHTHDVVGLTFESRKDATVYRKEYVGV